MVLTFDLLDPKSFNSYAEVYANGYELIRAAFMSSFCHSFKSGPMGRVVGWPFVKHRPQSLTTRHWCKFKIENVLFVSHQFQHFLSSSPLSFLFSFIHIFVRTFVPPFLHPSIHPSTSVRPSVRLSILFLSIHSYDHFTGILNMSPRGDSRRRGDSRSSFCPSCWRAHCAWGTKSCEQDDPLFVMRAACQTHRPAESIWPFEACVNIMQGCDPARSRLQQSNRGSNVRGAKRRDWKTSGSNSLAVFKVVIASCCTLSCSIFSHLCRITHGMVKQRC